MSEINPDQSVVEYSQKALEYLKEYNIAATPKAYEVWYQYASRDSLEVVKAIEDFKEKGGTPDKTFTERVHANHLSYDTIARTVDSVTGMLNEQISDMSGAVTGTDAELSSFSDVLIEMTGSLEDGSFNADDAGKLNSAVDKVNNRVKELEGNLEVSQSEIRKLQHYLETVRQEANVDPLTGLSTRKRYDQGLSQSVRSTIETEEDMCIAFFEVDHYDAFKSKWGQTTSEQILRFIGGALKENIKGRDTAARYASSTFALILPRTAIEGAKILADHIRNTVERKRIVKKTTGEFLGRVTLSVGIAKYSKGESIGFFSNRCDRSLLAARLNGRNCTVTEVEADEILSSDKPEAGVA